MTPICPACGVTQGIVVTNGDEKFVCQECGFSDDESMHWLLSPEESIGTTPIEALRAGRKAEVRRVAQALARNGTTNGLGNATTVNYAGAYMKITSAVLTPNTPTGLPVAF